ncbi:NUDIX hydrolase [candidate division KSB1 bacterium]
MKNFITFISGLKKELQKELPGLEAQLLMAPQIRIEELRYSHHDKTVKKSSVLILLYHDRNSINTVFIQRNKYDGVHSGQMSFPGGQQEKEDNNLVATALREAYEEINVDRRNVKILGNLTPLYIPPSNYDVLPVIGYSEKKPDFIPDIIEVNKIIEVKIKDLINPNNTTKGPVWSSRNVTISAPYYFIYNVKIWGATAMIVSELIELIKKTKDYSQLL